MYIYTYTYTYMYIYIGIYIYLVVVLDQKIFDDLRRRRRRRTKKSRETRGRVRGGDRLVRVDGVFERVFFFVGRLMTAGRRRY